MKVTLAFVLCGLCAAALASSATFPRKYFVDKKEFAEKQKDIFHLFKYVNQPSYYKEHVEVYSSFSYEAMYESYSKPEFAKYFFEHYETPGYLPKGEVFSVFNQLHLKQAIKLFKLFYYAKDYETFHKTAVWARHYMNEGMYVYALSVAVVHRPDTFGLVLPPIYEIFPHYFYTSDVIHLAQQYKQHHFAHGDQYAHQYQDIKDGFKGYTVHANYSGWYLNVDKEQSMSYFTEDVGINSFYWYYNIYYPFWMDGEEFHLKEDRRGEQYYYVHQQLLARYYNERLSNGLGEIPYFEYEYPVETGFEPSMEYPNGLHFPARHPNMQYYYHHVKGEQSHALHSFFDNFTSSYVYVKDYERRIRDAIDAGFVFTHDGAKIDLFTEEGFNTLGNLIEGNADSVNTRFYGYLQMFVRQLLGYAYYPLDAYHVAPSALEHFETSLRDPMFWQMYKRVVGYFQKYKSYLPHYTKEQLWFEGVKVEQVEVDRLVTFFDYFYADITNAVYVDEHEFNADSFAVRARQHRLNHKPFTYKVHVHSDKATEAFVKVFVGPKYDEFGRELDIHQARHYFYEFDRFHYALHQGANTIERSSAQSHWAVDRTTYKQLYHYVMTGFAQGHGYDMDATEHYWTFPHRFVLPKGTFGGQTFQFYVIVLPFHADHAHHAAAAPVFGAKSEAHADAYHYYPQPGAGTFHVDNFYPLGFPFDRTVDDYSWFVPNAYFKDIVIYHKKYDDVNAAYHDYEHHHYEHHY